VLSPTWFALSSEDGDVINKGSVAYTASAHKNGYQVWALVSNGFKKDRTKKFLASKRAQDVFIARMLAYAAIYGLDGINIDFESVANDDAPRLTSFIRRLSEAARSMGLVTSIDVMVPSKWSKAYQRKELSEIVDYVAVMTYDEHWRTSPKAGSTASLPWVRAALERTLAEVPASKLLLGIPLYTREWVETKDKKGKVKVSSKTMAMASVDVRQDETSSTPKWLPNAGQNYLQFTEDDGTHKIWIEDDRSIALRMGLVEGKGLAGAAFWRRGFEKPEIWEQVTELTRGR
jgi:spore germination protein YaaH